MYFLVFLSLVLVSFVLTCQFVTIVTDYVVHLCLVEFLVIIIFNVLCFLSSYVEYCLWFAAKLLHFSLC